MLLFLLFSRWRHWAVWPKLFVHKLKKSRKYSSMGRIYNIAIHVRIYIPSPILSKISIIITLGCNNILLVFVCVILLPFYVPLTLYWLYFYGKGIMRLLTRFFNVYNESFWCTYLRIVAWSATR